MKEWERNQYYSLKILVVEKRVFSQPIPLNFRSVSFYQRLAAFLLNPLQKNQNEMEIQFCLVKFSHIFQKDYRQKKVDI